MVTDATRFVDTVEQAQRRARNVAAEIVETTDTLRGARLEMAQCKRELDLIRAKILTSGEITGRNADEREAALLLALAAHNAYCAIEHQYREAQESAQTTSGALEHLERIFKIELAVLRTFGYDSYRGL